MSHEFCDNLDKSDCEDYKNLRAKTFVFVHLSLYEEERLFILD